MFDGAMTALVTPFRNGEVDLNALAALVERQIVAGIHGIVVLGTTGEAATLTAEEQVAVIRRSVEVARKRVPIIAGASSNCTRAAVQASEHAAAAGADALLHVTPYYNKPTQEGMFQHFSACARATKLPVILYNVPSRTSSDLLPETVARLAILPGIVAIKEATGDMDRAAQLLRTVGKQMKILSGDDFSAFSLFQLGGHGVISVVSNVTPGLVAQMWNATVAGDITQARQINQRLLRLVEILFLESNPIPVKAALEMLGYIGPELRLPMTPASQSVRDKISAYLRTEKLL